MHIRISENNVNLPDKLPTPRTHAAVERAVDIVRQTHAASSARDKAERAAHEAKALEPTRRGRAIAEGVDPGESPVAAAEEAAELAQADILAFIQAQSFIFDELRTAVIEEREGWTAHAATEGDKAIIKLTTALRMAQEAREELYYQIGVLGMYDRGVDKLSLFHPRESSMFDIDAGIEGLRAGLSGATRELSKLRPEKAGKGKKSKAVDE